MTAQTGSRQTAFIGMALHRAAVSLEGASLAARVAALFPGLGAVEPLPDGGGGAVALRFEDGMVASVIHTPSPLARAALRHAEADAARAGWSDVAAALSAHQAHSMTQIVGDAATIAARRRIAAAVSAVTAALTAADGVAAFWPSGRLLSAPAAFTQAAERAVNGDSPVEAWIGVDIVEDVDASRRVDALSRGAAPFLGHEVDWIGPAIAPSAARAQLLAAVKRLIDEEDAFTPGEEAALGEDGARVAVRRARRAEGGAPTLLLIRRDASEDPDALAAALGDGARAPDPEAGLGLPPIDRWKRWFGVH